MSYENKSIHEFDLELICEYFYIPQITAQEEFLKKHAGNKIAEELVQSQRYEAEFYRKYKEYYGYVFYIGKKIQIK